MLGLQSIEAEELRYHTFSDTLTLSCVYKSFESFDFIAFWTMLLQHLMWKKEGKFLRGSIVYGDLYDEGGIIFGPAMVEAYELAEECANWPRIIVSEDLLDHLEGKPRQIALAQFVRKDDQGFLFIDYLRDLFHSCIDNTIEQWGKVNQPKQIKNLGFLGHPLEFLQNHKESIEKAASNLGAYDKRSKTKIMYKYKALSEYHNKIICEQCEAIERMKGSLSFYSELSDQQLHNIVEYTKNQRIDPASNPEYIDPFYLEGLSVYEFFIAHPEIEEVSRRDLREFKTLWYGGITEQLNRLKSNLDALRISHDSCLPRKPSQS